MSTADLAETVEVLCHQMFYRAVGMEEAGSKQGGREEGGGAGRAGSQVLCVPFYGPAQ